MKSCHCGWTMLSQNPDLTTLICTGCIKRLRDASSFKILVTNTEKQFLDFLTQRTASVISKDTEVNTISFEKPLIIKSDVKVELIGQSDGEFSDNETVIDTTEDKFQQPDPTDLVEGEVELLSRFPIEKLRSLPTSASLKHVCAGFAKHLKSLTGKCIVGRTIKSLVEQNHIQNKEKIKGVESEKPNIDQVIPKKKRIQRSKYREKSINLDTERNPYTLERHFHVTNISALLEYSNLTPFRTKHQRSYPCFYCNASYEDFDELRKHQMTEHNKKNVRQCVLDKYRVGKPDSLVVYADVKDLKCIICETNMSGLKELKCHLTSVHNKKMYLDTTDRVIPFKVSENNFVCQNCGTLYETFGAIERHMNMHYRNYVCEECDSGFVTKHRLKIHGYLMHPTRSKNFVCEKCDKQFSTQQKRKTHVETVHDNIKKYKCNRCPERFNEYFRRHKHMVVVHGVAPIEYKCNICEKTFNRRYSLSVHMRTHIQQKDVYCEICPYRCFTKIELKNHMVKHNGERIFECSVCKKSYAREKTLKEHMKIHTNDRRFVCPVCGMAFIQNCSLKSHIKSHHKEHGLT
ncbi:hypothetical protein ACJJTC_019216 [Scirpophaga incertulas]